MNAWVLRIVSGGRLHHLFINIFRRRLKTSIARPWFFLSPNKTHPNPKSTYFRPEY